MSQQPLIIIVGATGRTGGSIVNALVKSGNFRVASITRPASLGKPEVSALQAKGVEIRAADIVSDSTEQLVEVLSGADVVISAVTSELIPQQKSLFAAAKVAGVKRVVPCDFGTPGVRGVRELTDEKLVIRDFVKGLGVGYTFIDVGWWMQLSLPAGTNSHSLLGPASHEIYGNVQTLMLVTNLNHIGDYVARIIADERTINQYVIIWEDEVSQEEAHAIGEKVSGEGEAMKAKRVHVSEDELLKRIAASKEEHAKTHSWMSHVILSSSQYRVSMHVLGENTLKNAKALGALDVRELYPDIVPMKLEQFAREFYQNRSQPSALTD